MVTKSEKYILSFLKLYFLREVGEVLQMVELKRSVSSLKT
jgi:hypothetical protein